MTRKEQLAQAREERMETTVVFDGPEYSITLIPYNYEIYIKVPSNKNRVGRYRYCSSDHDLSFAHELAQYRIKKDFSK